MLQPLAAKVPLLIGGSADLYGSTLNYIGDLKTGNDDFKPGHRSGRNIRFGIREHGMCSILNGIAAHGIFRPSGATFLVFADYCRAAIRLAALSLPYLEQSTCGRIVNVTSTTVREPIDELVLSNAIRPGVIGWAKTLARELGPKGITVNSIAPGSIDTARIREVYPDGPTEADLEEIPLRRLGTTREIGDVAAFLCSERAAYISGAVIVVDGGATRGL